MEIKANYIKHTSSLSGEVSLDFRLTGGNRLRQINSLDELFKKLQLGNKLLKLALDEYRNPRSLSSNSYFHLLCNKIAEKIQSSDDEVKYRMVVSYGALARDSDGLVVGFKLPANVNATDYYKYAKYVGEEVDAKGRVWNQYVAYKETHKYDTKEMARLIDGTVDEAKRLDIEVKSPDEIASMLALMEEHEKQKNKSV